MGTRRIDDELPGRLLLAQPGGGGVESQRDAFAPPARGGLAAGARVGRYELISLLGAGGMADVWLATQSSVGGFRKRVALKTIRPSHAADPSFRSMFKDEACLAVRIRHANVVEVLDLGEENGILYQAMSVVEGGTLSAIVLRSRGNLGRRGLPAGIAARIIADVLRGLSAAHNLRTDDGGLVPVIHRDVCPRNVLVGFDGVAKLADFGIALAGDAVPSGVDLGRLQGKLRYLAPERRRGAVATPRSDLYSVSVVLWEALTGLAFDPSVPPVDPSTIAEDVPSAFGALVLRGLAAEPERRFSSATSMADAIENQARAAQCLATSQGVGELVMRALATSATATAPAASSETAASLVSDVAPARSTPGRARVVMLVALALGLFIVPIELARYRAGSREALARPGGGASLTAAAAPPQRSPLRAGTSSNDDTAGAGASTDAAALSPSSATAAAAVGSSAASSGERARADKPAVKLGRTRAAPGSGRPRVSPSAASSQPTGPTFDNPYE